MKLKLQLFLLGWLFLGCRDSGEFPSAAGPYVYYYINNQTSRDLFTSGSFNSGNDFDTVVLPYGMTTNFIFTQAYYPEFGKPSASLNLINLMDQDSINYKVVYSQEPLIDSLWETHDYDSIPNFSEEHWTLTVVDSMLQ